MYRPSPALLLALGLAAPGAAQAPATAAWTLAHGEYTIYGHTTYTPRMLLLPRIVYDTAQGVDSASVVDSVRLRAATQEGFAAGMSAWPADLYCTGPASATMQPLEPREVLGRIQLAARCGVRLVIVPPRRFLTTNRRTVGAFSVDSAKRVTDRYAAALPADTIAKYRETIIGFNLTDDYNCVRCWEGKKITQAEIAEWAAHARAKLPGLPLGVRGRPDWVAEHPPLAALLDYAWAQYDTRRGDQREFYDRAAAVAAKLGLKVVMGVNVEDCYGGRTDPCSAEDLVRFGTLAVRHPGSCAFINWRYDADTWARPEIRAAWDEVLAVARTRRAEDCRRPRG
jgi:hypothetical protein